MAQKFIRSGLIVVVAVAMTHCVTHIKPYKPKVRKYIPDQYETSSDSTLEGSLFSDAADTLFTHRRSSRVGDLITVVVAESANANDGAGTELSRSSEISAGIPSFLAAMKALQLANPNLDPSKLLAASSKNEFSGKGATQRAGRVSATLTARIKRILPNGDFYLEGGKVVLVNEEESHLYISGVVRPSDIQADNSVLSSVIADAQVEYTGRGVVADKQSPGWLSRVFDWIWPF